jgi:hypothetical protein
MTGGSNPTMPGTDNCRADYASSRFHEPDRPRNVPADTTDPTGTTDQTETTEQGAMASGAGNARTCHGVDLRQEAHTWA